MTLRYTRLSTATTVRRDFAINMGLRAGYDGQAHTYTLEQAESIALDWMAERAARGDNFLTGQFTATTLAYVWREGERVQRRVEPAFIFSGVVSVTYAAELTDETIVAMLEELADRLGGALEQTRIYLAYRDLTWVRQADGRTSPRGPHRTSASHSAS